MNAPDTLRTEIEYYEHNRLAWSRDHENAFVVIRESSVGGFFSDYESALRYAVKNFGIGSSYLIKQVCRVEPVLAIY